MKFTLLGIQCVLAMITMCSLSAKETQPAPLPTGLVWDARYANHDTGKGHPENAERLQSIEADLKRSGLWKELKRIEPRAVEDRWILLAHSEAYLDIVKAAHASGARQLPTGDTPFSAKSLETARLSAGGLLEAIDQVMEKKLRNAFVASRPPGHHATRERGMGFCVFGNVGIAAKYLQEKHGLERILVVDWDVHHGNGTYDILKEDPKVFQFQIHQGGIYPGSGAADEVGEGEATGNTISVPLPAGAGIAEFRKAFEEQLLPAMERFKPQFILISAGFDAHEQDRLGGLKLRSEDYATLTRMLMQLADEHGEGRIVSVLEGGYHLEALAESVRLHLQALQQPANKE